MNWFQQPYACPQRLFCAIEWVFNPLDPNKTHSTGDMNTWASPKVRKPWLPLLRDSVMVLSCFCCGGESLGHALSRPWQIMGLPHRRSTQSIYLPLRKIVLLWTGALQRDVFLFLYCAGRIMYSQLYHSWFGPLIVIGWATLSHVVALPLWYYCSIVLLDNGSSPHKYLLGIHR